MRRSKINSREDYMNYSKSMCINHIQNDAKFSRSHVKISKISNNEVSRFRNFEKPSFKKSNLCMESEPVQSSSEYDSRLYKETPLILCSKDEIRKLAESLRTDLQKDNYWQCEKPSISSDNVNCLVKEMSVDINKNSSFFRGVNAKMPVQEMLHMLDYSSFNVGNLINLNNWGADITKEREISSNNHLKCFASMSESNSSESSSPCESLEARQPSPVSVLESSLHRKRITADPKDLLTQLGLLKQEQEISFEQIQILNLEKDDSLNIIQEIDLEFSNEEERDFSYLLDMLIDSGFHSASNQKKLLRLCYEPDSPIRPSVFSNLEKKYKTLNPKWSRSERKLLFDTINSILAGILSPCFNLRPWVKDDLKVAPMWGPEGLIEKIWQILVKKMENLPKGKPQMKIFDFEWIELGGFKDLVGREIERRIKDELIEELVCELLME